MKAIANPFSATQSMDLFEAIAAKLDSPGEGRCDHSHRNARAWCEAHGIEWPAIETWLDSTGGYCDCEVLFNTSHRVGEEA